VTHLHRNKYFVQVKSSQLKTRLNPQLSPPSCREPLYTFDLNVRQSNPNGMMLRQLLMLSSVGKALEHRSALTPTTAKALIDAGYTVNVERSLERIFDDSEFEKAGATLVPENTWRDAPTDHIIIGLKELPVEECKLEPNWF